MMENEIPQVQVGINQLCEWVRSTHRDPRFEHARIEAQVHRSLGELMGPGPSLTNAQAKRIGELDRQFRALQDQITGLM